MLLRVITAFFVTGLCAFSALTGWDIVKVARAPMPSGADRPASDWIGVQAISAPALDDMLNELAGGIDAARTGRRADLLAQLLSARPLYSAGWLSLAGTRLVMARPHGEVLAALKMSWITAPNEQGVMWQRGIFGLLQWEALPADVRQRTIADLSGVILDGEFQDVHALLARRILTAKAPEFRSQIAAMFTFAGVSSDVLSRMGLQGESLP